MSETATTIQNKPEVSEIDYTNFWNKLKQNWSIIYKAFTVGNKNDVVRANQLLNFFLGDNLNYYLEIESTVGEINRIGFDEAKEIVEIYISPRLKKDNIPYMEKLYSYANTYSTSLHNLHVNKYRAYNPKDLLIKDIEFSNYVVNYTDVGCQINPGYDTDDRHPLANLVIYVKKTVADHILEKRKLTVIMPDKTTSQIEKWLPNDSSAIDALLLNVIGEYNLIHNIGYIELVPEGDPIIADGDVFTALSDIKGYVQILERCKNTKICNTCSRRDLQRNILTCTRCKVTTYCCKKCQIIDYKVHKNFCKKLN
jgi:hypothetical protein